MLLGPLIQRNLPNLIGQQGSNSALQTASNSQGQYTQEQIWRQQEKMAQDAFDREQISANQAMQFSSAEAQKQRDWTEQMSNTTHQRGIQDLKAAGLNPILSATGGASSIGAGSSASGVSAQGHQASTSTENQLIALLSSSARIISRLI